MKYDCLGECSPVNIGWHTYEKTTVQFEIFIIKILTNIWPQLGKGQEAA